jgi:protein-S-isoprenylcysteine O-methyltransferase Ste14
MNANTSAQTTSGTSKNIGPKVIVGFAIFALLMPAVLFVSANRLDWVMGWVFAVLIVGATVVSRVVALRKYPDLAVERARSLGAEDAKPWDKVIVPIIAIVGPLATWIVAGLNVRFGWLPMVPLALQIVAIAIVVFGYAFASWAMASNKFFSGTVRIQTDRGHTVVTDGPYRIVRHPSYTGAIVSGLATPLLLGSWWALIPAGLTAILFVIRTALEDRTLQEELDGYRDFARQVRYRLLPGVW